jgi:two-component system OmpR family response regulator
MRLLLVEDHPELGPDLKRGLEECRYAVDLANNGNDGMDLAMLIPYDLIILDVMLPDLDGWEICRQIRAHHPHVPLLFLTARDGIDDRVHGLDLGADDYLTKPFAFRELTARVRALLRRESPSRAPQLRFLDITLDPRTYEVRRGERLISLSRKECALLEILLRSPGHVLSRGMITEHLWDFDTETLSNVIDVYIGHLRQKLCAKGEPNVIQTIRNVGYQLKESVR